MPLKALAEGLLIKQARDFKDWGGKKTGDKHNVVDNVQDSK